MRYTVNIMHNIKLQINLISFKMRGRILYSKGRGHVTRQMQCLPRVTKYCFIPFRLHSQVAAIVLCVKTHIKCNLWYNDTCFA